VLKNTDGYIVWVNKSSTPNVYKWSDYDKLVSFILSDMLIYDPTSDDTSITNWYGELLKEVRAKQMWVE